MRNGNLQIGRRRIGAFATWAACGCAVVLMGTAGATSASAALTAYDGLRAADGYANGARLQDLSGLSGPSGWSMGAWTVSTPSSTEMKYQDGAALTYPTVAYAGGGGIEFKPTTDVSRTAARSLSTGLTVSTTPVYMSFLMRVASVDATGTATAAFTTNANSNRGVGAGVSDGKLALVGRTSTGGLSMLDLGVSYQANTTYYFVIKLTDGGDNWTSNDAMEAWVNPANVSSESAMTASAPLAHVADTTLYNGVLNDVIGRLLLSTSGLSGNTIQFDEFRLGTDLASVVPEPAALSGVAAICSALLIRRRTRFTEGG